MTELSFSNTSNKNNEFSMSNLFSIFFHFCFSIFSHPLYFSYFLFFSPYLFKLLSFLSPLFITTTLLLVALLTFTPNLVHETFLAWLVSKDDEKDEEIGLLGEFEAYLVMFQASIFEVFEPKSVEDCSEGFEVFEPKSMEDCSEGFEDASSAECSSEGTEDSCPMEEPQVEKVDKEEAITTRPIEEVKSLETLFQENAELEDKDKEVNKVVDAKFNKVEEESKEKLPLRSGSKVKCNRDINISIHSNKVSSNSEEEHAFTKAMKVKSQRVEANLWSPERNWEYSGKANNQTLSSNLGSFGSMRVEKEWRRTLACKLFEERHNNDGSEGMDMLWETYETDSNKVLKKSSTKKGKKNEVEYSEDEEEEEEEMEGKLCCLQALKFSAGKMNLGMGRPNLLKFSKAFKGIGWLHHVGRHGKKSNH